jgi:Fe-S-cluster containining protein
MSSAFNCQMCGHCCEGEGGIILGQRDRERLAAFLGLGVEMMLARYARDLHGKPCVRTGEDGYCVFFKRGKGCTVHPGRPDICRAWPFFRGNLMDENSWIMIQEYCPGVNPETGFAEFVRQGRQYLVDNGLVKSDPACEAVALILPPDDDPASGTPSS